MLYIFIIFNKLYLFKYSNDFHHLTHATNEHGIVTAQASGNIPYYNSVPFTKLIIIPNNNLNIHQLLTITAIDASLFI